MLYLDTQKNSQRGSVPLNAACHRAAIEDFRAHDLRHTTAAWLVQAGVPLLDVLRLLRHSSVVMTQRYAHLAPTSARQAVEKLAGGDNPATALPEHRPFSLLKREVR